MINVMRFNSAKQIEGLWTLCSDVIQNNPAVDKIAEIGCYSGESGLIFNQLLKPTTFYLIDKWGITDKYKEEEISEAEKMFDCLQIGTKIKTHSRNEKVKEIINHKLDFIYIDASHHYVDVKADILFYLPLLKEGGVIAGHDYLDKFRGVVTAVNEIFKGKEIKIYKDTSWAVWI